MKKAGFSRLKMDDKGAIQFPKSVTSHFSVMSGLEKQGWKSVNREGALNRGNTEGYMTKGDHGISVSAGSTQWNYGVSVRAWQPVEEQSSGMLEQR